MRDEEKRAIDLIGVGKDRPRDTSPTHCSPHVLLGAGAEPAQLENSLAAASSVVARCGHCQKPDASWMAVDLVRGKRGMRPGPGVEYHCMLAFYGAQ